ncbi:hypothetical protein DERF_006432 [Dermatophagoides farinae]|uniref:DNA polymerase eta n=1 Tax=Dermatophagoides farinae TaxID=6954 RepID=A0A922LC50_DERFA|nr:hypothetical protein DERF_006432 [Dermatophagoides farinae]
MSNCNRIIALIDMDCFYVQCEQRLEPDKWLKPCAVAQYNNWKGGGIIAVNYEARSFGIKRGMRGDQAKQLCPELHIFRVPDENGKAKLDKYRDASTEVFQAIADFIDEQEKTMETDDLVILERASVDEAFLDLTKMIDAKPLMLPDLDDLTSFNTKLEFDNHSMAEWFYRFENGTVNHQEDIRLVMAAIFVGQIRQKILERTQFKCSAGISHNKMLSKLACGLNKPNAQTILPMMAVPSLFKRIDISDVRLLGGKLGRQIKEIFDIQTMYQLSQLNRFVLNEKFDDKTAEWLYDLANGFDNEQVSDRRLTKSLGCGKNFRGKNALNRIEDVDHWIKALLKELYERMMKDREMNDRLAKLLIVGYYTAGKGHCHRSITIDITSGNYPLSERIAADIMQQLRQNLLIQPTYLVVIMEWKKLKNFFPKIDRNTFVEHQSTKNQSIQPQQQQQSDHQPNKKSKSPMKKRPPITNVQSNTMDRYLNQQQRPTTSTAVNNTKADDKIDLNDPNVRQT